MCLLHQCVMTFSTNCSLTSMCTMRAAACGTCVGCFTLGGDWEVRGHAGLTCTLPAVPLVGSPLHKAPPTLQAIGKPWTPQQVCRGTLYLPGLCLHFVDASAGLSVFSHILSLSPCVYITRVALSAVGCAALRRRAAQLFWPLGLAAAAATNAASAGASAGTGGAPAAGDGPERYTPTQQPQQHQRQHPAAQHRHKHSHD